MLTRSLYPCFVAAVIAACSLRRVPASGHEHEAAGDVDGAAVPAADRQAGVGLPASATSVQDRLARSPRHGEWAIVRTGPNDSVRAWVVYPERPTNAPVVVVIHEIFGLSTWIRGVADQLAADGYIAIAPDLLTGKAPLERDTLPQAVATAAIRTLQPTDVQRQLEAVGRYGMSLPAAQHRYGVIGFCWGGSTSFAHAVESPPGLMAAVVFYGTAPARDGKTSVADLGRVKVPVLGLYGGNDQRVDATIPTTDSAMKALGKTYEPHVFAGAGHGFLRAQEGSDANLAASRQAWPLTIAFFRRYLGA